MLQPTKEALDPWQREILEHDGNILLCTGRQVGKTTLMAIKCAEYMINHNDTRIVVVSLSEDQAILINLMILDYLEKHWPKAIAKGKHKPTQNRIILTNKSQVVVRPVGNTGNAIRGFTGDILIIDEAARMPELVFEASKPVLASTGGKIWMCSTPHGKQGYFYDMFIDKHQSNRFKVWHVNTEEVYRNRPVSQYWTSNRKEEAIKFLEHEKKDMSELSWGQEYLGKFLDDLQQFFPDWLIEKVCTGEKTEHKPQRGVYLMGCDLARLGGDSSVFSIFYKPNEGKLRHVEMIKKKGLLTTQNEEEIRQLDKSWNLTKIGLDAGSGTLGVSIYDHLFQDSHLRRKIVAMNNRTIVMEKKWDGEKEKRKTQRMAKEDYYDNLRAMMERGEIELLRDMDIMISLKSIQVEVATPEGSFSYLKIFSHPHHLSDIAESLVRAAFLSKEKSLNLWISYI